MMFLRSINEFVAESEMEVPGDLTEPLLPSQPDTTTVRFCRGSRAAIPSTLRRIRRQLLYDVGNGFLLEPHVGPELGVALHINLKADCITMDCPDTRLPVAVAWAVHAGLGAATLTHGGLPLHGAGMEIEGNYIGLIADSGVGKSTLSWFLLQNGARFGNDDLIPVYLRDEQPIAFPAVSLFPKLSREAVDRNGLEIADLLVADYGTNEEEYYVPLPREKRMLKPKPLVALFLLSPVLTAPDTPKEPDEDEVTMHRLSPEEASSIIAANLHTVWLIGKYMNQQRLFARCVDLFGE
jgi:hypothetical protein